MNFLAVTNGHLIVGLRCLGLGVVFTGLGLLNRWSDRKKTKAEIARSKSDFLTQQLYWDIWVGPLIFIAGIVLVILGLI